MVPERRRHHAHGSLRVYRAGPLARLGHDHLITSQALAVPVAGPGFESEVLQNARDSTRRLGVPLRLVRGDHELSASGSFRVRQSRFGLTPFSVAVGAIQVGDEVDVAFEIHAVER